MEFTPTFLTRYRRAYNALEDVDEAHATLTTDRSYLKPIRQALGIIHDHGASGFVGVTLLHRHFDCSAGTVFVERRVTPRTKSHKPVLVTSPVESENAPKRLAPHRFAFVDGGLQPLEFTTDRAAVRAYGMLADVEGLHRELADGIAEAGLSSLLGVGIYARERAVFTATNVFFEETDFVNRKSVVHVLPRLARVAGRRIPTLWTRTAGGNGCCSAQCQAYCSHSGSGIGYCGHRKSGHIGCV